MKLFYRLPMNIYINDIGTSFNFTEMEKSRNFEIHVLRDTETNNETKFVTFTNWEHGSLFNRFFPVSYTHLTLPTKA